MFHHRRALGAIRAPFVAAVGGGYTGPGDIVGSAVGWWGLRAYTSASIGANAIRLKESGGSTEQNFATIAGGGLDLSAIAAFKGANNLTVTILYDQSGGGRNLTPVTQEPTFTLSGLGSLPVMGFVAASGHALRSTSSITQSQPDTVSAVLKVTNNASAYAQNILCMGTTNIQQVYQDVDNTMNMYAGGTPGTTAAGGTWHAIQCIFNGASGNLVVDASSNPLNPGTDSIGGTTILLGARSGQNPNMSLVEIGLWGSAFNSTQYANMDANQSAYWGV